MCTVTIIPWGCEEKGESRTGKPGGVPRADAVDRAAVGGAHAAGNLSGGYRLVTNRDENRKRPQASPPAWRVTDRGVRAIYPVDPAGGGTWIASNEAGLTVCLLNLNPMPPAPTPDPTRLLSRGKVVTHLIGAANAADVLVELEQLELERFSAFRLAAIEVGMAHAGRVRVLEATWDGRALETGERTGRGVCMTSSGLGDCLVAPRLELFERFLARHGARPEMQDRFHEHQWEDRPEISVMMSRTDARTVSRTVVEAAASGGRVRVDQRYEEVEGTKLTPGEEGEDTACEATRWDQN